MIYTHAAAAVIALALGFTGGWKTRAWKAGADDAQRLQAQAVATAQTASAADSAAAGFEKTREVIRWRTRTITQEVDRVVDRPIYRDRECLDADGLHLVAAAAAGAAPAASQPAAAVPASGPAP